MKPNYMGVEGLIKIIFVFFSQFHKYALVFGYFMLLTKLLHTQHSTENKHNQIIVEVVSIY